MNASAVRGLLPDFCERWERSLARLTLVFATDDSQRTTDTVALSGTDLEWQLPSRSMEVDWSVGVIETP